MASNDSLPQIQAESHSGQLTMDEIIDPLNKSMMSTQPLFDSLMRPKNEYMQYLEKKPQPISQIKEFLVPRKENKTSINQYENFNMGSGDLKLIKEYRQSIAKLENRLRQKERQNTELNNQLTAAKAQLRLKINELEKSTSYGEQATKKIQMLESVMACMKNEYKAGENIK